MTRLFAALAALLLTAPAGRAEEAKTNPALVAYLENLQLKLDHAAQRANQPTAGVSNVVGVRGSKAEPTSKQLYWKGKEKPKAVSVDEVRHFRLAVEQARAGQTTEALVALKEFGEKYPKSALTSDVDETVRLLSAPSGAAATTTPSP
jgi:TolA-binding protein